MITIVDYGVGNIGALINMFDHLGIEAKASTSANDIVEAKRLILPGVGAFDKAMVNLKELSLIDALNDAALNRQIPVLGICLGMQLFSRKSEEGNEQGLGWINADVKKLVNVPESILKLPHIGWSEIMLSRQSELFLDEENRFYFVHGYHVVCDDESDVLATVNYGQSICCAVHKKNIFGVQFHPEKSHAYGMRMLSAFAAIDEKL
jgi:glutamine amidotransferase